MDAKQATDYIRSSTNHSVVNNESGLIHNTLEGLLVGYPPCGVWVTLDDQECLPEGDYSIRN